MPGCEGPGAVGRVPRSVGVRLPRWRVVVGLRRLGGLARFALACVLQVLLLLLGDFALPLLERIVGRSEEHTSELQSLMRISYAVFCLKKKKKKIRLRQRYDNYA